MKYKCFYLYFNSSISDYQEDILIVNIRGMRDEALRKLKTIRKNLDGYRAKLISTLPANKRAMQILKDRLDILISTFDNQIIFHRLKKNRTLYLFAFSQDLNLVEVDKVFFIKLGLRSGNPIDENKLVEGLKRYVFRDAGITDYLIKDVVEELNISGLHEV